MEIGLKWIGWVSDDGSDEEDDEPIPVNNGNYSIVNDDSNSNDEIEKNIGDHEFDEELKVTLAIILNQKVIRVMKNLQALYDEDMNKIVEQATQEKAVCENLNFWLIWLQYWLRIKWPKKNNQKCMMKLGITQMKDHVENSMRLYVRNFETWKSNRWRVLCTQIDDVSNANGGLKWNKMVRIKQG